MKNELELTRQQICDILGVTKSSLKKIENKGQLHKRLKEKGYDLVSKEKRGRNNYYVLEEISLEEKQEAIKNSLCESRQELLKSIPLEYHDSIGVYKITLGNKIYIGSTVSSFFNRFREHRRNRNKLKTKEMIQNGGVFEILQICDGMDEPNIRKIENDYIQEYRNNPNYVVINERDAKDYTKTKPKKKYKNIKVKEKDYEKALEILKENGINIELNGLDTY